MEYLYIVKEEEGLGAVKNEGQQRRINTSSRSDESQNRVGRMIRSTSCNSEVNPVSCSYY